MPSQARALAVAPTSSTTASASASASQPQSQQSQSATTAHSQRQQPPGALPLLKCGPILRYCGTDYPDGSSQTTHAAEKGENAPPIWRGSVLLVIAGPLKEGTPAPEVVYTGQQHVVSSGEFRGQGRGTSTEDGGIELADNRDTLGGVYSSGDRCGGNSENQSMSSRSNNIYLPGKLYKDSQGLTRKLIRAHCNLILAEDSVLFYRYDIRVPLESQERAVTYIITGVQKAVPTSNESPSDNNGGSSSHSPCEPSSTVSFLVHKSFYLPSSTSTMRILFHSCNGFSVGTDEAAFSGPALWNDVARAQSQPRTAYHVMIGGGDQIYSDEIRVSGPLAPWTKLRNHAKRRRYPYTPELALQVNSWYRENYIQWYSTPPFSDMNASIPAVNMWDDHDIIDGYGSYTDKLMRCPVFMGLGRSAWKYYMVFQHHTSPEGGYKGKNSGSGGDEEDSCWILSPNPGPYIGQQGRSIYARLGHSVCLVALDARTERTRHVVCQPETYDAVFSRLDRELSSAAAQNMQQPIKHVLLLLGIPIAYPRLVWLENILHSPVFGFLKFLNKRFGIASKVFNKFDGEVDILDDLDDHWTASTHKRERAQLIKRWQELAQKHSVRVTVLSGDVHLAALGKFYHRATAKEQEKTGDESELTRLSYDFRYTPNVISSAITNQPPPLAVARAISHRNKIHRLDGCTDETLVPLFREDVDGVETGGFAYTMPRRNYCSLEIPSGPGYHSAGSADDTCTVKVEFRVEINQHDPQGETKGYEFFSE